jgi:RNA methyltransferase, TrmH family
MQEIITSTQNPKIKNIIKLQKTKNRKNNNLIMIEGEREIFLALESGIKISEFYYCSDFASNKYDVIDKINNNIITSVSAEIFKKIAYKEHPDGYLALAEPKHYFLKDLKLGEKPLVVVLEGVEKPGNLGAILRTADAAGVDAVLVCDGQTDIYNPNVIRASQGTVFTKQVAVCTNKEVIAWLKEKKIKTYAAALNAKKFYDDIDYNQSSAIVFGTEDKGLSEEWLCNAEELIKIPMHGEIDSLNVSNSAAIIIFEALRQRKK